MRIGPWHQISFAAEGKSEEIHPYTRASLWPDKQ